MDRLVLIVVVLWW